MDLHSMLNNGPAPVKKSPPPPLPQNAPPNGTPNKPIAPLQAQAQTSPPAAGLNGSAPPHAAVVAGFPPPRPDQKPPPHLYTSHSSPTGSQSRGLTPLRTPGGSGSGPTSAHGHGSGSGSYPFPAQHSQQQQSPVGGGSQPPPPHQYRPYESSVTTPGGRPPSHGYSYPQPSPSQYGPAMQAPQQQQHHPSQSPTPSSHHSQTPHSMRQSPLTMGHAPLQPHQYHHSQPNTPLGPPSHLPRHPHTSVETSPPYHQRTWSGASNGLVAVSPAQHHTSIGSLVESPNTLQYRPSPQKRSASDYQRQSQERERSVSVSPKTKVPPRPPSLGSRHSSQHEIYSARSSLQPGSSVASQADGQNHVQAHSLPSAHVQSSQSHMYAQPQPQHPSLARPPSDVAQAPYPQTSGPSPASASHPLLDGNKAASQHQPQRMGMNHLLAPSSHEVSAQNGHHQPPSLQVNGDRQAYSSAQPQMAPQVKPEPRRDGMPASTSQQSKSLKRSATDSETDPAAPPPKRERRRKYTERPLWANLHPSNPRYNQPGTVPNSRTSNVQAHPPPYSKEPASEGPPAVAAHPNATSAILPVDEELAKMRKLKGSWEKSITGTTSLPDVPEAIAQWLHSHLQTSFKSDGKPRLDKRDGTLEIEAKIGRISRKGTNDRLRIGARNAVVLDPQFADNELAFQSEMNEREHQHMNRFLNERLVSSQRRSDFTSIDYKHLRETDHFRKLSKAGISALPSTIPIERLGAEPHLRTTVDDTSQKVTAQIIKVKLGNLHVHNPLGDYDLRVTVNIECNLMRDGFDESSLTEDSQAGRENHPSRKKDRLSYKHLDYQVDLTRVDVHGMAPKYELELEVDANALEEQMAYMQAGQENGFINIVEGFWENAKQLMKQRVT